MSGGRAKPGPKPKSRHQPTKPWWLLTRAARSASLSIEAKGVLLWMLGQQKPVTKEQVQEGCKIGVAKAGRILRDLRAGGYIRFRVIARKADGYARWHYELNVPPPKPKKKRVKGGSAVDPEAEGERSERS